MRRRFYSTLFALICALLMSGCSMSGIADGSRSAVNGNRVADEVTTADEHGIPDTIVTTEENIGNDISSGVSESLDSTESPDSIESQDGAAVSDNTVVIDESIDGESASGVLPADIPVYSGKTYCELNGNIPTFRQDELVTEAFENYSDLDHLGRCGVAYANICKEIMPTEERGEIGMVKPSGWHTVKYSDRIDGNYLYNRCHLIGYQLAGENANEKNLITGTRYLNVTGMLPFENEVADYVESTGNHVLYRVTPVYDGDDLVASGVIMEAESVEDSGAGVSFDVYVYNVQPGVIIDYATGDSEADPEYVVPDDKTGSEVSDDTGSDPDDGTAEDKGSDPDEEAYIVNTNTGKFHKPGCRSVKQMKESNKSERTTTRDELISEGYEPCKNCNP